MFPHEWPGVPSSDRVSAEPNSTRNCGLPGFGGQAVLGVSPWLCWHYWHAISQRYVPKMGGGKGRANCSLCSPRMLRAWSLAGGCEMCLGGTALPCIPSLCHQRHLVPALVPSPALPGPGSHVLGSSCCSAGGLGLASRGAKGPVRCRESSVVSQSSLQAALRSQAPAKQPLGGGKPTPPTKCRSMMDMQSPTGQHSPGDMGVWPAWEGGVETRWTADIRGSD